MKATHVLTEQHDALRNQFKQLRRGNGHTIKLRDALASSLVAHMVVEQELFYPSALRELKGRHREERVLECYEEHAAARFALERLVKADSTDRTFKAKLALLEELTRAHFKEEEDTLFPKVEKALGEASKKLAGRMHALFERMEKSGYATVSAKGGAVLVSALAPQPSRGREAHAE